MGLAQQSVCSSRGNGPLVNVAVLLATFLSGIQRERMKPSQFIEEVSPRAARRIRVRRATTKRLLCKHFNFGKSEKKRQPSRWQLRPQDVARRSKRGKPVYCAVSSLERDSPLQTSSDPFCFFVLFLLENCFILTGQVDRLALSIAAFPPRWPCDTCSTNSNSFLPVA